MLPDGGLQLGIGRFQVKSRDRNQRLGGLLSSGGVVGSRPLGRSYRGRRSVCPTQGRRVNLHGCWQGSQKRDGLREAGGGERTRPSWKREVFEIGCFIFIFFPSYNKGPRTGHGIAEDRSIRKKKDGMAMERGARVGWLDGGGGGREVWR